MTFNKQKQTEIYPIHTVHIALREVKMQINS